MKKIKFYVSTGYVGTTEEEVMEFDDKDTDEMISKEYEAWVWDTIDAGWFVMEGDTDD